ncbi:MAG: hypothetical protein NTX85_00695 [Candidatus Nomurabacteria bacterium]|nr:hypothetical protein [Candidatus Nomurabacteria bacterium]
MTKKIISIFILCSFILGYSPMLASAAKTTKKVTVVKKKKKARKEKLTLNPPLFTLETAPHSPRPIARGKRKSTKKVAIKKPGTPSKVVATKKK